MTNEDDVGKITIDYDTSGEEDKHYVKTETPQPTLKDLVASYVHELASTSKELQAYINGAKTKVKRQYFLKKLRKNNKKLADALIRLEHVKNRGTSIGE